MAAENPTFRSRVEQSNAWIPQSLARDYQGATTIVRNAVAALHNYGFETSGARLSKLYARIAGSERTDAVRGLEQPGRIIDDFLDGRRYRPIVT